MIFSQILSFAYLLEFFPLPLNILKKCQFLFEENTSESGILLTQSNLLIKIVDRVKLFVLESFKTRICQNQEKIKNVFLLRSNSLQRTNDLEL